MAHDDEVRSYCRICAASCGIVVTVDRSDGTERVVSVQGHADHPASRGYTCPKGRALPALHHHADRLDVPVVDGRTASWDDALDDLALRLGAIVERYGADAIAGYFGTGLAYDTAGWVGASAWLNAVGSSRLYTPATVDNAPVLLAAELVAGHPQANPICDYDAARLVLVVGSNPVVSHGYGTATADPITRLRSVQRRGGAVVVVDPRRTETAALADRHIALRPGSDAIVLAWLTRERLAAPLSEAARASTAPLDREQLARSLEPFTLARAARAAGVGEADLLALRDLVLAADGALAAWCGTGVTMGRDGAVAEWLRWVLLALSGSLDTHDGMLFHRGIVFRLRARRAPSAATTIAPVASRPELGRFLGQDPCVSFVDSVRAGDVRALVVAGANPITAFPDPSATTAALRALDALAVVYVAANPLTAIATHVLPAAGQLERADVPMHELVAARGGTCFTPAVVARGAQRRAAWSVFADLAARMGTPDLFGAPCASLTDTDVLALVASRSPVPFVDIVAAGPHGVDVPPDVGWVRDALLDGGPWRIAPPSSSPVSPRSATLPTRRSCSCRAGASERTTPSPIRPDATSSRWSWCIPPMRARLVSPTAPSPR